MYHDAERALVRLRTLTESVPMEEWSLALTKYFIKALVCTDEHQMAVEDRTRFQQLQEAESVNEKVLVQRFKLDKFTVYLQIKRLTNYKAFMKIDEYTKLS
jgi:hypothetical protein